MPHPRSKKPKATAQKASPNPSTKHKKRRLPGAKSQKGKPTSALFSKQSAFVIGDQVSHPQFGDGTVTAIDGGTLTITFVDQQVRQILDCYVKRRKG